MQECSWEYAGHGVVLECGRSDEIVTGRCGSGENRGIQMILLDIILKIKTCLDCPGGTSHGNLCCELDYVSKRNMSQTGGRS